MADWPPVVNPVKGPKEKENIYLTLVDMFVDVVEPSIIQMILQNRNWDLDGALEDIMILASTASSDKVRSKSTKKTYNEFESLETTCTNTNSANLVSKTTMEDKYVPSDMTSSKTGTHNMVKSWAYQDKKPSRKPKASSVYNQSPSRAPNNLNKTNQMVMVPFLEQYNYVKAIPAVFDRVIMLIRDGVKLMVILRGPPGSGKSHLAKRLLSEAGISPFEQRKHIFSTDEFFVQNNVYTYINELLGQAHSWNQRNVLVAIREQISPIVVDNTNTQAWEMRTYAEMAVSAGYDLEILEPDNWWLIKDNELAKRNVHGVPKSSIRSMIDRFEKNITPKKLLQQFEIRYSLSSAPPQPVTHSKWKEKLRSQKSNKPKKKKELSPKPCFESNIGNLNDKFKSLALGFTESDMNKISKELSLHFQSENNQVNCTSNSPEALLQINNLTQQKNGEYFVDATKINSPKTDVRSVEIPLLKESETSLCSIPKFTPEHSRNVFESPTTNSVSFMHSYQDPQLVSQNKTSEKTEERKSCLVDFDFMAESNKLLADFTKPSYSNVETKLNTSDKLGFTQDLLLPNISDFALTPDSTENKISVPGGNVNSLSELNQICNRILEQRESHNTIKEECSWDYVVVNNDHTFTYKILDFEPLPIETCTVNGGTLEQSYNINCDNLLQQTEASCPTNYVFEGTRATLEENFNSEAEMDKLGVTSSSIPLEISLSNLSSMKEQSTGMKSEPSKEINMPLLPLNENDIGLDHTANENSDIATSSTLCENNIHDSKGMINSENLCSEKEVDSLELIPEKKDDPNLNVFGMMKDILSSMAPFNENSFSSCYNQESTINSEKESLPLSFHELQSKESEADEKSNTLSTSNMSCGWDDTDWNSESKEGVLKQQTCPKPSRNIQRPRISTNIPISFQSEKQEIPTSFVNWNTVSDPLKHWGMMEDVADRGVPKGSVSLPQRSRLVQKQKTDSSTNTNYLDFVATNNEIPAGVKILTGICRNITTNSNWEVKPDMSETVLLDKSTMTSDNQESIDNFDIKQISSLFPNIPQKYILDIVEKCQGDINWAVDILLDSEHSIYNLASEEPKDMDKSESIVETTDALLLEVDRVTLPTTDVKIEQRSPNSKERQEVKKMIESSIVIGKSHYSDKILKVLKKKHPQYLKLIERNQSLSDKESVKVETIESHGFVQEDVDENEENGSSSSWSESESEDDTLQLILNNDFVVQLQQKFGNSSLPKIMDTTSVVKLPVSLARQLYGYIMDSLQADIDEQQSMIESMIAKDEEVAKFLQYQDHNIKPQLQEIMDMEVALEVHRADQEEWKEKSFDTVAAKLSKNILLEKFSNVDPKMLMEVFHAHNFSLHDTVASLSLALGVDGSRAPEHLSTLGCTSSQDPFKESRFTSVIVDEDKNRPSSSVDSLSEAQTHRDQAATYYSLRIDCLNKASEAFRSGNKAIATYYSQLAQLHKDKIEHCNSRAASCLLSSHKSGSTTLDLHFLHISEAAIVLDMFLDEVITFVNEKKKRHQAVYLITGRGLRSIGGVSRIKPMVQRTLQVRQIPFCEVNPGMLSAVVRVNTPMSHHNP